MGSKSTLISFNNRASKPSTRSAFAISIDERSSVRLLDDSNLMKHAFAAMGYAFSPYSNVRVGAALLTNSDNVYLGANIGNACSTMNCCAEQVAIIQAVMAGEHSFKAIAITQNDRQEIVPCGRCLQLLSEFSRDLIVITGNMDYTRKFSLIELLPYPYRRSEGI